MNFERAKEIYFSPKTIEVLHKGNPVWITNLDTGNQQVEIKNFGNDIDMKKQVPATQLSEGNILS